MTEPRETIAQATERPPKVQRYKLETVLLKDIETDPLNPNRMTERQEVGLEQSLLDFGDLHPIILSEKDPKTGKHKIADGEHRLLKLIELGESSTDAFVIPKLNNDVKRRMVRQIMNRLHGEHDLRLQINELSYLLEKNPIQLEEILGDNDQSLAELQHLLEARSAEGVGDDFSDGDAGVKDPNFIDNELPTKNTCPSCGFSW